MIMVYKHMMSKTCRTDVTNWGNLFIVGMIWTTLVALVPGGKLLVLVKLIAVSVGGVFFQSKNVRANICTCDKQNMRKHKIASQRQFSLFICFGVTLTRKIVVLLSPKVPPNLNKHSPVRK